jgi:hypothetical protein
MLQKYKNFFAKKSWHGIFRYYHVVDSKKGSKNPQFAGKLKKRPISIWSFCQDLSNERSECASIEQS